MNESESNYLLHNLTLRQLQILKVVADLGSHTRASELLQVTQPTISIQLTRLSETIGMPLFESFGRRNHLTDTGRLVYEAASEVLAAIARLEDNLSEIEGSVRGELRIAVVTTAKYFIPYLLGSFVELYPEVTPRLTVSNREQIIERLLANEDDLCLMGQVPEGLKVEATSVLDNELVLVAHPDHPLARSQSEKNRGRSKTKAGQLPLSSICRERFLLREPGSGTRLALDTLLAEHSLSIRPYMELGNSEAIKQAVLANLGISVLSETNLRLELAGGHLVTLKTEGFPMQRRWYAVHLKGKQLSLTARTFLQFLIDEAPTVMAAQQKGLTTSHTRGE